MKYSVQAHAIYKNLFHIVWIPKYRRRILKLGVGVYLERVLDTITSNRFPEVKILERNIQQDHIHMLLSIPPKYAVSEIVRTMKSESSRLTRKKFEYLRRCENMWSVGYFSCTVGINERVIRNYIKYQEKQDKGQAELVLD